MVVMNKELRELVDLLWRTTLVVDGNLRVKTLAIPWKELAAEQQKEVIEHLRRLTVAELKNLPSGMRLRLEFESIPKRLRQMLVDVAGDDNPEFQWGRTTDEIP